VQHLYASMISAVIFLYVPLSVSLLAHLFKWLKLIIRLLLLLLLLSPVIQVFSNHTH